MKPDHVSPPLAYEGGFDVRDPEGAASTAETKADIIPLAEDRLEALMRVLITGITGFLGSHLAEFLLAQGCEVVGLARDLTRTENLRALRAKVKLFEADIRDAARVETILAEVRPDHVYHLAARAFIPEGDANPQETYEVNVMGTRHLLEALRRRAPKARALLASTARVYGCVTTTELPVTEAHPVRPIGPYAVSKARAEALWGEYYRQGILGLIVRSFNHIGPRQSPAFVGADFARQIVAAEMGRCAPVVSVGNLDVRRDFLDVRDAVRAYWLALNSAPMFSEREAGSPPLVNVCSGEARSIQELLEGLLRLSTISPVVVVDERRWRSADVPVLVGDPQRLRQLGWKPRILWEQTLSDMLDDWRERLRRAEASAWRIASV